MTFDGRPIADLIDDEFFFDIASSTGAESTASSFVCVSVEFIF